MGLELVTTFHAARPPLMWSIEPKMRATLYGSEKLVETVAPSPTCVVQAASAEIRVVGSKRHRNDGWSVGSIAIESEMNSRSNLPRSAMRAISCITGSSMCEANAPSMRQPAMWLPVPSTKTPRCI